MSVNDQKHRNLIFNFLKADKRKEGVRTAMLKTNTMSLNNKKNTKAIHPKSLNATFQTDVVDFVKKNFFKLRKGKKLNHMLGL